MMIRKIAIFYILGLVVLLLLGRSFFTMKSITVFVRSIDPSLPLVKIFCFSGNEIDIVDDWVNYYGTLFEYENIYVIDNFSDDGTYYKLLEYSQKKGVNVLPRVKDYRMKGIAIKSAIEQFGRGEFVIALLLDMDEFIVLLQDNHLRSHVEQKIIANPVQIKRYMNDVAVDRTKIYKMDYLNAIDREICYNRPIIDIQEFSGSLNYDYNAKGFIFSKYLGDIDHGNHLAGSYALSNFSGFVYTKFRLLHFYSRGYCQIRKKVMQEAKSLGYDRYNLSELNDMVQNGSVKMGQHNLDLYIADLKGELFGNWKNWFMGINGTGLNSIRVNSTALADYSPKIKSSAMKFYFQHYMP